MDINTAREIAYRAHDGVCDKQGQPYILHVQRVAENCEDENRAVAWLHDVVEDTDITLDELREKGLTEVQAQALSLVTRDPESGLTYMEWIRTIASAEGPSGQMARAVKLTDVKDNLTRPRPAEMAGIEKRYQRAERILEQARTERGES